MKKIVKKISFLTLIFILASTGCNSGTNGESKSKKIITGLLGTDNTPASVAIHYAVPQYSFSNNTTLSNSATDNIKALTREYLNTDFTFVPIPPATSTADISKQVGKAILEKFDALIAYGDIYPIIKQDYAMDLTEELKKHAPNYYARLTKEALETVTYDGRIMAIPALASGSSRVCAVVKADLLKELNITSIGNFEEFEDFLRGVKTIHPELLSTTTVPPSDIFMQASGYAPFTAGFVHKWDDSEMKLVPWEKTSAFWDALAIQDRWTEKEYLNLCNHELNLWPPYHTSNLSMLIKEIQQEKLSSFIATWDTALMTTRMIKGEYDFRIFPLNVNMAAPKSLRDQPKIIIGKNARHVERILKLIEWIHSDQRNYDLFMYGIEGKNYSLEDEMVRLPSDNMLIQYGWLGSEAFVDSAYERAFVTDVQSNITGYSPRDDINLKHLPTAGFNCRYDNMAKLVEYRHDLLGLTLFYKNKLKVSMGKAYDLAMDAVKKWSNYGNVEELTPLLQSQLNEWVQSRDMH